MTTVQDLFPSRWITATDLGQTTAILRIRALTLEEVQGKDGLKQKPVLWFHKAQKGLVLNKTNAKAIAKLHGDNIDGWTNKHVELYTTQVQAFGEMWDVVRVRPLPTPTEQTAEAIT